ncbi:MAG TPA: MoaD/ThiS family protein [Chloroflexota bacterium]|jgi:molybdopterin converting factor small subunit|nr:MoaD/ThiS family protein [Chloroflexota bacterium]
MADEVSIVLLPWVPKLIGKDEARQVTERRELRAGETVQQFLVRYAGEYPELHEWLWDEAKQELKMPVEVAVNGSVLGIHHSLDSELHAGDEILLLPQYQGG